MKHSKFWLKQLWAFSQLHFWPSDEIDSRCWGAFKQTNTDINRTYESNAHHRRFSDPANTHALRMITFLQRCRRFQTAPPGIFRETHACKHTRVSTQTNITHKHMHWYYNTLPTDKSQTALLAKTRSGTQTNTEGPRESLGFVTLIRRKTCRYTTRSY